MISARSTFLFIYKVIFEIKRENKRTNMADKTEKAVDLGILEEDDEFEEFPAEDWKETNESELKNVSNSIAQLVKRRVGQVHFCWSKSVMFETI